MNIRSLGAELLHTDGQTNRIMMTLKVAFRDFANAPKTRTLLPLFEATTYHFNVFILILFPFEGRAGEAWETSHTVMLDHLDINRT
jgi:hypothetical protein